MTELRRTSVSKAKMALALLFSVLTVLLTACPGTDPIDVVKPEISLSVDKSTLTGSGNVTLKADVTKGVVTSVTFKANKGAAIPPVIKADKNGDFVATVTVSETTTFTAEATGPGGTTATPPASAVTVTVTPPTTDTPVAPSPAQAFKTYREVTYLSGVTPTEFSATSAWKVDGIKGDVQAENKSTSSGGTVDILTGKDMLVFTYKPKASFLGDDSFDYTVSAGGKTATGTIKVSVGDLPSKISKISTLSEIAGLPEAQTIILTKQIFCGQNPCVTLKARQVLTDTVTTTDGVTITSPTAGILADIPETRQPGTPACRFLNPQVNCTETVVIELADDVIVEGIEISGTDRGYFVGLRGRSDKDGVNTLSGNIAIKNVTLKGSNGKPIYVVYGEGTNYGNYNLLIENLDLQDANDTLVIGNPKTLMFKNSKIELVQPFGDNVGINIDESVGSEITIDNVDIFMESTEYKLDIDPPGFNAAPFIIDSRKSGAITKLIVKNTDITIEDIAASDVFSFKVRANNSSTMTIIDSNNNTAPRGAQYGGDIDGEIDITP